MRIVCFVFMLAILSSCSSASGVLSDDGKEVQLLANKPGDECSVVGKVLGESEQGSPEMARNHARNLAAKVKGNALFINQEVPNGAKIQVFGTAYHCE